MLKRREDMTPVSSVIDENHPYDRDTPKGIERQKPFLD
jgi:hypothetical protein